MLLLKFSNFSGRVTFAAFTPWRPCISQFLVNNLWEFFSSCRIPLEEAMLRRSLLLWQLMKFCNMLILVLLLRSPFKRDSLHLALFQKFLGPSGHLIIAIDILLLWIDCSTYSFFQIVYEFGLHGALFSSDWQISFPQHHSNFLQWCHTCSHDSSTRMGFQILIKTGKYDLFISKFYFSMEIGGACLIKPLQF